MALNFPINPSVGQTYQTGSSATYRFNGTFWDDVQTPPFQIPSASFAPSSLTASHALKADEVIVVSSTAPTLQITGSLWFNSSDGGTYIETASLGFGTTWQLTNDRFKTYVTGSEPTSSRKGDLWFDTSANELLVDRTGRSTWQLILTGSAGFKNITKMSTTGYGGILLLSEGKVFCIKGNDPTYASFMGAISPNSFATGLRRGIANAYEIPFPDEVNGTCTDMNTYGNSAYALFENGDLYTWGQNNNGQLGTGDTTNRFYPVQVQTGVSEVYSTQGENDPNQVRLLIKKTDGKIYGTGYNGHGELGLGIDTAINSFTELPWAGTNPLSVWNLGSWRGNIFVQKSDGQIWVSGRNDQGQLGVGNLLNSLSAQQVSAWLGSDLSNRIIQMFAGHRAIDSGDIQGFTNMMLLRNPNTGVTTLLGAGYGNYGQLGRNSTSNFLIPVAPLGTWTNVRKMAYQGGAVGTVYVIKEDGTTWMWGWNGNGQLGTTNTTNVLTPAQRAGIFATSLDIVAQPQGIYTFPYQISSALIRSGADNLYYSTGYNDVGNLGRGIAAGTSTEWGVVRLPSDVTIKFLGTLITVNNGNTSIAVDTKNRIWAWGWNEQQQIDGESAFQKIYAPIQIVAGVLKR